MKIVDLLAETHRRRVTTPKVIYHGTLRINLPDIMKYGLLPQVGSFSAEFYNREEDEDVTDLVFGAARNSLPHAWSAIVGHMVKTDVPYTLENVKKFGALLIIDASAFGENKDVLPDGEYNEHSHAFSHPSNVEARDYYSFETISPKAIKKVLTGDEMLTFFQRDPRIRESIKYAHDFYNWDETGRND